MQPEDEGMLLPVALAELHAVAAALALALGLLSSEGLAALEAVAPALLVASVEPLPLLLATALP